MKLSKWMTDDELHRVSGMSDEEFKLLVKKCISRRRRHLNLVFAIALGSIIFIFIMTSVIMYSYVSSIND